MITPLFDPRGNSLIHRVYPLFKIIWVVSVTIDAFFFNNFISLLILFSECLIVYLIVRLGKETPMPPIFSFSLFAIILLFGLNYLLLESKFGLWHNVNNYKVIFFSYRIEYSLCKALALGATMLSFFCFTLSTYPRDIARTLERLKISRLVCEPIAIALRYLPTFEVNLKMQYRLLLIKYVQFNNRSRFRNSFKILYIVLQSILVMALSQANITGKSLFLRGFNAKKKKYFYDTLLPSVDNFIFITIILIHIISLMIF